MHTFQVVVREPKYPGLQFRAEVVRNDGRVVRTGMWPDDAVLECARLNEASAKARAAQSE